MLDIGSTELIMVALVALVVIGPKDLPKAMRVVGYWVGRARSITRQFRSGFDAMVREAELAEMEKKWAEENDRIMREHPGPAPAPLPAPPAGDDTGARDIREAPDKDAPAAMVEQPVIRDDTPPAESDPPESEAAEPAPKRDTDSGDTSR
ncbi:Sec-independent protein translocase protein TatB [Stakelama sp. CBK3Z-3]|uniref:Sec-independent protein translocase protein TatB n=1 Tax=Stakelama flava TaxID=2860338 RepID=A0ABS6XHM0_9SPHN|nr:Sec-independent protein translocase protein TatB [Stakelama flava]MBW4329703.1 Sec-independent protein translocase protein TatB [Stakelama flava]